MQAVIAIQMQHVIDQHNDRRIAQDSRSQPRIIHLDAFQTIQHIKAQPQRHKIGQHNQQSIRRQIERIEKLLIPLDHLNSFSPVYVKA